MPEIFPFLKLGLLAGFLGLDSTGALQLMLSRPLVAGGLAGWLLGDLGTGLAVGSLVELLWMGGVPIGSLVPPDGTQAAIFAAAAAVTLPGWLPACDGTAASSLGLLLAVPVGSFGAKAEILQRHWINRLSRHAEEQAGAGRWSGVGLALLGGLALAWLRGTLAMLLVLALGLGGLWLLLLALPPEAFRALQWGFWLAWLLGLAVAIDYFWDRRGLKALVLVLVAVAVAGSRPGVSQLQLLAAGLGLALLGGCWAWRRSWLLSRQEA
jgi:PTS system mannose-specific IIC component